MNNKAEQHTDKPVVNKPYFELFNEFNQPYSKSASWSSKIIKNPFSTEKIEK